MLGPITSVSIRSTFNRTFFDLDKTYDEEYRDRYLFDKTDEEADMDSIHTGHASEIRLALAQLDGTSLIGSPMARAWPLTALFPTHPSYDFKDVFESDLRNDSKSNGCFEILRLAQLLQCASVHPLKFEATGHASSSTGVPPYVLRTLRNRETRSGMPERRTLANPVEFVDFATRLRVLHLKIAGYSGGDEVYGELRTLKSFFEQKPALEVLTLTLPFTNEEDHSRYRFSHIFPPVPGWRLENLHHLHLSGICVSFNDLTGLLFFAVPNLSSLTLRNIILEDGSWDDIVEGLRHLDGLNVFALEEAVYSNQHSIPTALLAALSHYVTNGGRHPGLTDDEPNHASIKYMSSLNKILERFLRAASV
ncbi:MAG: hypothetical protein Q9166_008079 [cf. Caloplaca sp. 2 TL-2023]